MKNQDDGTFNLKEHFACDSSNFLYVVLFPTSGEEYTDETAIGKTKLRDHDRVYRQQIRQREYKKTQGKRTFENEWLRYL